MGAEYKFQSATNSLEFFKKSSARVYAGGTISANTNSETLTIACSGMMDVTVAGLKVNTNTPAMLTLSGSLFTLEWKTTEMQYTGTRMTPVVAWARNTAASTKAALTEYRNSLTSSSNSDATMNNLVLESGLGIAIIP